MKLTLDIIRSYGFKERTFKPDWDDTSIEFTLPNNISLNTMIQCNNRPCESDSLEGLDGFIYIETKEQLDELLKLTYKQVLYKIASENKDFKINQWI